jgi:bacteriorhodopsin
MTQRDSGLASWLRRTDWLWMIVGGFYLVAYLFWYLPALRGLPGSAGDPPGRYPWHWTLDFAATGVAGAVLVYLGFRRATELSPPERTGACGGAVESPPVDTTR